MKILNTLALGTTACVNLIIHTRDAVLQALEVLSDELHYAILLERTLFY